MANRITFKIKIGFYLEILTLKKMKLLASTNLKITKDVKVKMCLIQKLMKLY